MIRQCLPLISHPSSPVSQIKRAHARNPAKTRAALSSQTASSASPLILNMVVTRLESCNYQSRPSQEFLAKGLGNPLIWIRCTSLELAHQFPLQFRMSMDSVMMVRAPKNDSGIHDVWPQFKKYIGSKLGNGRKKGIMVECGENIATARDSFRVTEVQASGIFTNHVVDATATALGAKLTFRVTVRYKSTPEIMVVLIASTLIRVTGQSSSVRNDFIYVHLMHISRSTFHRNQNGKCIVTGTMVAATFRWICHWAIQRD